MREVAKVRPSSPSPRPTLDGGYASGPYDEPGGWPYPLGERHNSIGQDCDPAG